MIGAELVAGLRARSRSRRLVRSTRSEVIGDTPDALRAGEYFIVVSMNPKFEEKSSSSRDAKLFWSQAPRLNADSRQHYEECASHFAATRRPHSFFETLKPVAESFAAARRIEVRGDDRNAHLRRTVLALEAIPFFSRSSGHLANVPSGSIADINRRVRLEIMVQHPPCAIYVHGAGGHEALTAFGDAGVLSAWRDGSFEHRKTRRKGKRAGTTFACRYQVSELTVRGGDAIKVVWTPFVRSVHGPGTREQRAELGALLANGVATSPH